MPEHYDGWRGYNILIHEDQYNLICEYQDQIGVETIQEAIMQAIRMALKKEV